MTKIDIISDPVCPWCYLGKGALDRAMAERPDSGFVVEWHPFQLNPETPPEGYDRAEFMASKFGDADGIARAHETFLERAKALGLPVDLAAIKRTPNSLDAHRLIHWAGIEGRQHAAVAALFRAYWAEGKDIGDHAVLADIAEQIGMDRAVVETLLASDADRDQIIARERHSHQAGVTGVPTFIVGNRHAVVGAQPVELWLDVIDELNAPETETIH